MSWAWTEVLPLAAGRRRWVWAGPQGVVADGDAAAMATMHGDWSQYCAAMARSRVGLVVSAQWVRDLVIDPSLPLRDPAARLAHAAPLLQHYHGGDAANWPLVAWQQAGLHGVSALQAPDLPVWQQVAQAQGIRIVSLQPAWSRVLAVVGDRLARPGPWRLLWAEATAVVLMCFRGRRLLGLGQRRLAQASLSDLLTRLPDWEGHAELALTEGADAAGGARGAHGMPTWVLGAGLAASGDDLQWAAAHGVTVWLSGSPLGVPSDGFWGAQGAVPPARAEATKASAAGTAFAPPPVAGWSP